MTKGTYLAYTKSALNQAYLQGNIPNKVLQKTYIVQPGDSLWKIAKTLYGNGRLYSKIYEANKDVICNPKNLHVGQKIIVPE